MMNLDTTNANDTLEQPPQDAAAAELRTQIDQRDETIRLLNEALSQALDELAEMDLAA